MSFLTPLYLIGALAIAGPILFHLIRRMPKGEVPFSSLMFLEPTPPKLTRRSRLDNIPLLILRAMVLGLLALAFSRPFLREAANFDAGNVGSRRVVILMDSSASMRRGDLAAKARSTAKATIAASGVGDQLAVIAFDGTTRPLLTFDESKTLDPSNRKAVATARIDQWSPTWAATDLGQALIDAVGALQDVSDATEKAGRMPRRIILVSDLQRGARLESLGNFAWPADVDLELKTISLEGTNAGLQALADAPGTVTGPGLRVRVASEPGSTREAFTLAWLNAKGERIDKPIDVYVPPGEGRVVKLEPPVNAVGLRLAGDDFGFDNTLHLAAIKKVEATVLVIGDDAADDPNGLLYYLDRVFEDSPRRSIRVVGQKPDATVLIDPKQSVPMVVLTAATTAENAARLREFARRGGTVLVVLKEGAAPNLAAIADSKPIDLNEAPAGRDAMLGEIAFDHPLFASLAGAQFNDFTKIRFWKHRKLDASQLEGARILARFEGGDPAVVEKPIGKGRLVVLASGWGPADSQLARSSKFVPMMASLVDSGESKAMETSGYLVGDKIPIEADDRRIVGKPDGSTTALAPTASTYQEADEPGLYSLEVGGKTTPFAVNLDPTESRTSALSVETLEQLGCRLTTRPREEIAGEHLRQMQIAELEKRQKVWRALTLAALAFLLIETWLSGRSNRLRSTPTENPAT